MYIMQRNERNVKYIIKNLCQNSYKIVKNTFCIRRQRELLGIWRLIMTEIRSSFR